MLATSDPHFNDGYYFATDAEDWYVSLGMRLHPNTNTIDGFVNVARGGEQRAWRFTRALRPEHATLAIGPLRLSFAERMKQARFQLDDTGGLARSTCVSIRLRRRTSRRRRLRRWPARGAGGRRAPH